MAKFPGCLGSAITARTAAHHLLALLLSFILACYILDRYNVT